MLSTQRFDNIRYTYDNNTYFRREFLDFIVPSRANFPSQMQREEQRAAQAKADAEEDRRLVKEVQSPAGSAQSTRREMCDSFELGV